MLPKEMKLNIGSMNEVRLIVGDITLATVGVLSVDGDLSLLADKALFMVQTDLTMNDGKLMNWSFSMNFKDETYKVKVQPDRDNATYQIDIIRSAQNVGRWSLSMPGVKATTTTGKMRKATRPGDAFPQSTND